MKKVIWVIVLVAMVGVGLWLANRSPEAESIAKIASDETLIMTEQGKVIGYLEPNGSSAWLGVPFASPPIGNNRWRAPQPPESWDGQLEALRYASVCPQIGNGLSGSKQEEIGNPVGDEDCLYLNIWRPTGAKPGTLPVMLWIHGGGNSIGHGGSPTYQGANLAETHNVVVVTINYRLGPMGWFTHPALRSELGSPADHSGNYGTLDIVRALEWAKSNINRFGGNADNVTVFGESAGGVNVLTMMASPLAAGLYHKAIVQSGGFFVSSMAEAENYSDAATPGHAFSSAEIVNLLLVRSGRAVDRGDARRQQDEMAAADIVDLLRSQSAGELLTLYSGSAGVMLDAPAVFGDGYVLSEGFKAAELFTDANNYNVTPVMLGTNRDEVKLFMMLSGEETKSIFGIPYGLKDVDAYNRDARYGSDAWKAGGVDSIATALTNAQSEPVFAYRFDWDEEKSVFGFDLASVLGAGHGMEIGFIFGNFEGFGLDIYGEEGKPYRDELSNSMMSYWAEFAYSGNPGTGRPGKGRPGEDRSGSEVEWQSWDNTEGAKRLMVLDTTRDAGIRMTDELVTIVGLKAALVKDETFATLADKCTFYGRAFGNTDDTEYQSLGCEG
ncbi:MAG: para-nitrobenzyl esterase [Planctomycetaceae bacterium]|jgi:para-nitrobenzyl esterase